VVFGLSGLEIGRGDMVWASLVTHGQNDFLQLACIDALEQAAKGRLCRSGILALEIALDTKGPTLHLAQAPCKLAASFARAEHRRWRLKEG
jgi:hypothetical protein